jgi:hypothetical protein
VAIVDVTVAVALAIAVAVAVPIAAIAVSESTVASTLRPPSLLHASHALITRV